MTKVDTHSSASLQVYHEVRQVTVADAQYIVAHAERGVGTHKVRTESQECLGGCRELEECTTVKIK